MFHNNDPVKWKMQLMFLKNKRTNPRANPALDFEQMWALLLVLHRPALSLSD
jgi:hypothetical protein